MNWHRRVAVKCMIGTFGAVSLTALCGASEAASQQVPATASGEESPDAKLDPRLDPKRTKIILEQKQKDIKKDIQRLFQLATELKDEIEKTDAVNTLSLPLLKKTDEIERLARQIRDKAKG